MNKTPFHGFLELFSVILLSIVTGHAIQAQDSPEPAGQKDGINFFIRFAEPLDHENPKILCTLENTTDRPVPFQLQGAAEGSGFDLHLIDKDGNEIEKTAEWIRLYETGDSMHIRYGALRPGIPYGPIEIELKKAYGPKWVSGTRLDIEWNSREPRRGPGPFGGQFGVGSGVSGSLDLTPLTGKNPLPQSEHQESETAGNPPGGNPIPDNNPIGRQGSAHTENGIASNGILWVWLIGATIILLGGAFWLKKKSSSSA